VAEYPGLIALPHRLSPFNLISMRYFPGDAVLEKRYFLEGEVQTPTGDFQITHFLRSGPRSVLPVHDSTFLSSLVTGVSRDAPAGVLADMIVVDFSCALLELPRTKEDAWSNAVSMMHEGRVDYESDNERKVAGARLLRTFQLGGGRV